MHLSRQVIIDPVELIGKIKWDFLHDGFKYPNIRMSGLKLVVLECFYTWLFAQLDGHFHFIQKYSPGRYDPKVIRAKMRNFDTTSTPSKIDCLVANCSTSEDIREYMVTTEKRLGARLFDEELQASPGKKANARCSVLPAKGEQLQYMNSYPTSQLECSTRYCPHLTLLKFFRGFDKDDMITENYLRWHNYSLNPERIKKALNNPDVLVLTGDLLSTVFQEYLETRDWSLLELNQQ